MRDVAKLRRLCTSERAPGLRSGCRYCGMSARDGEPCCTDKFRLGVVARELLAALDVVEAAEKVARLHGVDHCMTCEACSVWRTGPTP